MNLKEQLESRKIQRDRAATKAEARCELVRQGGEMMGPLSQGVALGWLGPRRWRFALGRRPPWPCKSGAEARAVQNAGCSPPPRDTGMDSSRRGALALAAAGP